MSTGSKKQLDPRFVGVYVKIEALPYANEMAVLLVATVSGFKPYAERIEKKVQVGILNELEAQYRIFRKELEQSYPSALGVNYDIRIPNLFSAYYNSRPAPPPPQTLPQIPFKPRSLGITAMSALFGQGVTSAGPQPAPEPFEVNLTEPLVGWKSWQLCDHVWPISCIPFSTEDLNSIVPVAQTVKCLITRGQLWPTCQPMVAHCPNCQEVPNEKHTCGIYAADDRPRSLQFFHERNSIFGQMYGWGRYIRGEAGFRCQFAYPKSFLLTADQVTPELIEGLKEYRVPIEVLGPQRIYDPAEDGYADFETLQREVLEYEHRGNKEDGNCRASEDADSSED